VAVLVGEGFDGVFCLPLTVLRAVRAATATRSRRTVAAKTADAVLMLGDRGRLVPDLVPGAMFEPKPNSPVRYSERTSSRPDPEGRNYRRFCPYLTRFWRI
jgi:hypothetical protein